MSIIRVNPAELAEAASEIERVAEGFRGLAEQALRAAQDAPSYDGQFGPQVRVVGDEAHARLMGMAGQLSEFNLKLAQIAEAFEAADAQAVGGLLALASSLQTLLGFSLSGLTLTLLRPAHISEAVWNALPLEDRLAILEELGLYSSLGAGPTAGTVLNVLNPLRVRLEPGLNGEIGAYARPGSEVVHTGQSRTADGIEWYQVSYKDPISGLVVVGWVSSHFLSTGRSRVGFEPGSVAERFNIQTNVAVQERGGSLVSVTSNWLEIRDGPTGDYAVVDAPEWGRVVRWTGDFIEEGGHKWYEVIYNDDTRGWARGDRVADYVPRADAPPTVEGKIWVPLQQERSFSQYNLFDVDSYVPPNNDFAASEPIRWKYDMGPEGINQQVAVPYGALFGPDGVAMQGSGVVTVEAVDPQTGKVHQQEVHFTLDNPHDLQWANAEGNPTSWEEGGWSNGRPAEIANPEDAEFRPLPEAPELTSAVSLAGPPEYRGQTIWVPDLQDTLENNPDAVFTVEDAGGAFPHGSLRFDLYFEDAEAGRGWYRDFYNERRDAPVYVLQDIPPEIEGDLGS